MPDYRKCGMKKIIILLLIIIAPPALVYVGFKAYINYDAGRGGGVNQGLMFWFAISFFFSIFLSLTSAIIAERTVLRSKND